MKWYYDDRSDYEAIGVDHRGELKGEKMKSGVELKNKGQIVMMEHD
jgi:uncharacterized protein (UPF0248 family)